ncbi:MAG: recombinase family protein [Candidatus Babeliaceae bacterium]|nr:recombinase family protein [Candidatus Babeliaceae bacterium]
MEKAVIYARVSSKDQENEGFSIPAQVKFLHEYGSKNGFRIVKEFIDAETAKKIGRKQFNLMLNFIEENKIQHILVEKTDRLLRNMSDYILIKRLTSTAKTSVHLAKENAILGKNATANEKLIFGIRSVMAESYLDNLSEEVKKGMQEKAAQGTYPSIAPYGYLNARVDGKKVIVIDPDTSPLIKRMFELYATGSYSLLSLRKRMLFAGMIYKNGKALYTSKIETILKNVFYMGDFVWKGQRYENGSHEPIVSKELFHKVQTILRNPHKSKSRKGLFPYTNLIKCGICGCALTAEIKKEKYVYYRCSGYKGNCKQTYLKQEVLE